MQASKAFSGLPLIEEITFSRDLKDVKYYINFKWTEGTRLCAPKMTPFLSPHFIWRYTEGNMVYKSKKKKRKRSLVEEKKTSIVIVQEKMVNHRKLS